MAVASYTTDLLDFETFEGTAGGSLDEVNNFTTTQAQNYEEADVDNPIQGTQHGSVTQRTTGAGSIVFDRTTGVSLAAGEAFFFWAVFLQTRAVDTFVNDGLVGFVGTGTGDYYNWTIGGQDFGRNPYGGYANYVIDPTITANGRGQLGSPGTTYTHVGWGANVISAIAKGAPYNIDVIRYGRGELIITGGTAPDPDATFAGAAAQNDDNANRWGLFQEQFGTYLWKGLLTLGTSAAALDFTDSNEVIFIDNTLHVATDFNRIEINNAASNINWTAINISTLGVNTGITNGSTNSRGQFEMIDGATLSFDTCVFTDMDTFIFNKGTGACDLTDCTFRRCNQITQGGGTFNNCVFDATTDDVALLSTVTTANTIEDCEFIGDNTSHAVNLGNVTSSTSINWTSTFDSTTYAATSQAQNATSTSGDSEVILVNVSSGQTLTISVVGNGVSPTYRNTGGGTVSVVASKNLTISGIEPDTELRIYTYTDIADPNTYTELAGAENINTVPTSSSFDTVITDPNDSTKFAATKSYDSSGGDFGVVLVAHNLDFIFFRESFTLSSTENTSFTVFQIGDRNYDAGSVP